MRSLEEHREAILAAVSPLVPVRLPLAECVGLVLCEDITSDVDLPGFDNSAMDGYAVRAVDVAGAEAAVPGSAVRLPVVSEVAAGAVATRAGADGGAAPRLARADRGQTPRVVSKGNARARVRDRASPR